MSKKIMLISANQYCTPYPVYPLAIACLKACLKTEFPHFDVVTLDMNFETSDSLAAALKREQPDYIGLSLRNIDGANSLDQSSFIPGYQHIVNIIRASSSQPLIIGGAGFSIYAKTLFELLQPDFAVKGEGEKPFAELIRCLENGLDATAIEGLLCKNPANGSVMMNPRRKFTQKLGVDFDSSLIDYYWEHSGMLNIQTKRGCYNKCIYCSYPLIEGRKVRTLDTGEIVDNLERLLKEKGINYVFFTDSIFNIEDVKTVELAEKIIQRNLKIQWASYFSPSNITDEQMALYKRSGLSHIEFGTESFCDRQLKNYGKRFTFDTVLKTSEMALKHNVFYAHFLILGGYGETDDTLAETFENSKKLRYTVMFPFVGMRIYPGTRLQKYAIREGVIAANDTLLEPAYYISKNVDLSTLKEQAKATGKAWIFPDDIKNDEMEAFRIKRKKKGLIWEYLRMP